jgi:hypothetical protein
MKIIAMLLVVAAGSVGCSKTNLLPPTDTSLTISSVSPSTGFADVETAVVISGSGFHAGATVTIGGAPALVTSNSVSVLKAMARPHAPGLADVVVTNPNGVPVTLTAAFTYQEVVLTATPDVVTAGAPLTVSWLVPGARSTADWIGLFRADASNISDEDGWWTYTNGASSGALTIEAPRQPGSYEFRYLLNDGYADIARSRFTVTP